MEHRFGRAPAFALGLEEELLLVDPDAHLLTHEASRLLPAARAEVGEIKPDTYEASVELASPIARTAEEAGRTVGALRAAMRAAGATMLGAGIHPEGEFGDVVHVDEPRYLEIAESMRGLLRRTPTCALHVHVSMPDPETAIRVCNRLRAELPLLQALAANSPYWHGADSGLASSRSVLFRGYPRAEIPRAFTDFEDYAATTAAVVAAGDLEDYTFLWWDIRPHPKLGTVEVRAMDAQSSLATATGLTALIQAPGARRRRALRRPAGTARGAHRGELPGRAGRPGRPRARRDRDGPTHARARRRRPPPSPPHAKELGGEAELEEIQRVLDEGNGADRQRRAFAKAGMPEVLRTLVTETALPWPGDDRRQTTDDRA